MSVAAMPEQFDREEAIFQAAIELEAPDARADYVGKACGQDASLRERVDALLAAHDRAGVFLEKPISSVRVPSVATVKIPDPPAGSRASGPIEKPGDQIGRYKLLQQIGEGGCGVVYMAEQEEPVRRRVALKIIKAGMDTRQVIARFEAERQALAMMDHPNIARVLDAGATETGRPYFVMDLVRGIRITDYCDQSNMSTEERLRAVHPGLQRDPARAPEGHHSPRHQAVQHPGHAARRRARACHHRFWNRQGHGTTPHGKDALYRASNSLSAPRLT